MSLPFTKLPHSVLKAATQHTVDTRRECEMTLPSTPSPLLLPPQRHKEALEHARSAVFYNQEREEVARKRTLNGEAPEGPATGGSGENRTTRLATLAVSYYNLAVELEYTGQYDACLRW